MKSLLVHLGMEVFSAGLDAGLQDGQRLQGLPVLRRLYFVRQQLAGDDRSVRSAHGNHFVREALDGVDVVDLVGRRRGFEEERLQLGYSLMSRHDDRR